MPGPIWPLGGVAYRPRPLLAVTLVGPSGSSLRQGLADTASDDTVFPDTVAQAIGLDLTGSPTGQASGVGLVPAALRYGEVELRISDGLESRSWRAMVAFTSGPLKHSLLGYAGFLQFFTAAFHGDLEVLEMTVNSRYPGT